MCPLESGGNQRVASECCQKLWSQNTLFFPPQDSVLTFGGNKLLKLELKTSSQSLFFQCTLASYKHRGLGKEGKKCAGSCLLSICVQLLLTHDGLPLWLSSRESSCNVGDLGLNPGLGRSLGKGKGYPLQYCGLENSMNCIVHGVAKSQTRLRDFHFHF